MFNTIEEAIQDIKEGKMVVIIDDENRENEGDIVVAAEKLTSEHINFMVKNARGLVCMPMSQYYIEKLKLEPMVYKNTDNHETAFTVSIDYRETTTGISAFERALTVQKVLQNNITPEDFRRPGHMFPLKAREGGVLVRQGHTEAAVDLARMAGLKEAGVICEIMNEDGTMARTPELKKFVKEHGLKIITIEDLIKYRIKNEKIIEAASQAELPTKYGDFKIVAYVNKINGEHHIALVKGEAKGEEPILVRVHSECLTGDVFGSLRCDCGEQLSKAMEAIEREGRGIILYMRQEGRGIGLVNKVKAYKLQDKGMDTVEANLALGFPEDLRDYGISAQILKDLGVKNIKLMTNNPKKISGMEEYGVKTVERVPIEMNQNEKNIYYLKTKKEKMGHLLHLEAK